MRLFIEREAVEIDFEIVEVVARSVKRMNETTDVCLPAR
jgi:hypothetical protein